MLNPVPLSTKSTIAHSISLEEELTTPDTVYDIAKAVFGKIKVTAKRIKNNLKLKERKLAENLKHLVIC